MGSGQLRIGEVNKQRSERVARQANLIAHARFPERISNRRASGASTGAPFPGASLV